MTTILQPDQWGMRWAGTPVRHLAMPVGEVYVHQTAGVDPVEKFPSGDDQPGDAFHALNEYAINGKGYSAIDYSMLVHTGPSLRTTIGVARGKWTPAATLDRNIVSKAVCLLGWFGPPDIRYPWTRIHSREPFDQELLAIAESIVYMQQNGWVQKNALILGHRDNPAHPNATACPGSYLYAKLPRIRELVAYLQTGGWPSPPPEIPEVIVRYFTLVGQPSTLWGTSDGLTAVRLEGSVAQARRVDPSQVPILSVEEARQYVFVNGLTSDSVK